MVEPELVAALFLLLAALVTGLSRLFGRWYITMPMIFVLAGILFGPQMLGLVSMQPSADSVKMLAEITLAMILFADASTLSPKAIRTDPGLVGRLLVIALPLTILVGGLVAKLLYPQIPLTYALLIAAILAPTDAALGLAVYSNPLMPVRIRRALNIESGLNDGIASPIVILFLGMTLSSEGVVLGDWIADALLELGLALLTGVIIGSLAGAFLKRAIDRRWTSDMWSKLSVLAVALACYFLSTAVGGNGFVAAFVGGLLFGRSSEHELNEQTEFVEASGTLLSMLVWSVFAAVYISPYLPALFRDFDGRAVLFAILSLTLVRMLPVAISMIGSGLRRDTVLIMGWFGPRGLASVVFGLLAAGTIVEMGAPPAPLDVLVALTVLFSVFAHGLSAKPLVSWYARRLEEAQDAEIELAELPELPTRPRMLLQTAVEK